MFDPDQFCQYVIEPALKEIGLYSKGAEQLLLGTCCAESKLGTYLHQVRGPALGVFQMEPNTHADIWENYLRYRPDLKETIRELVPLAMWDTEEDRVHHETLIYDLKYAAVMARLKYRRSPKAIPPVDDWNGFASIWKSVYNSQLGAGTHFHFMNALRSCKVLSTH